KATLQVSSEVDNGALVPDTYLVRQSLLDAEGQVVTSVETSSQTILAKEVQDNQCQLVVENPHLWDVDDPYLYTLRTEVVCQGRVIDATDTPCGIRDIKFTADEGFFLNGRNIELKGVNCHQDHAGVGSAIPDALQVWRIRQLKAMGCNAYRASHNPMTPALLDVCDSLGMLVIDENRLMGLSPEHIGLLERMIRRDRNHPSIIMWSDGNEEWGLENSVIGTRMAASMREYTHRFDPSRPVTIANAGGYQLIQGLEVVGYNYIVQNDVMNRRRAHPDWKIVGTEETTGCGTRGVYFPDAEGRWMPAINRTDTTYENVIERGWKFYAETPWASGLFYWTGFDYRGEPNPLGYPAVGSEFGLLDYCGFPKDEVWYLRSWWTNEPVLHLLPHWNLQGHEGEEVDVWAYSNCEEVELWVNGKSLGRKPMPKNGHLSWRATYQPGSLRAVGYNHGRKVMEEKLHTTGPAAIMALSADRTQILADGRDVAVVTLQLNDKKGRFVSTACEEIEISLTGPARILGVGNGDPAFKGSEHPDELECQHFRIPTFNGLAQILIQSQPASGAVTLTTTGVGKPASLQIQVK
ncbi:MAG: glycoside hydrolase family 2 TIM barrel-domain containing protein, partial [Bacteroidales bacterium]|nr:glycoside hydrolase family 2 TIM barrel-domain containing protein [Bacteroidales bacterium]